MNLPFILDIGIGLVLIYLSLSLFASEIQELLATILQWRAKHLKQAIDTLLSGDSKDPLASHSANNRSVQEQLDRTKELVKDLYSHPLIRSLNQEAKGFLGALGQWVSEVTQASRVFAGRKSGPSYLPSETFATTLLEMLRTEDLFQKLSELKLNKLVQIKLLEPIREILLDFRNSTANESLLERELQVLETEFQTIVQSFIQREITLSGGLNQTNSAVRRFFSTAKALLSEEDHLSTVFLRRLTALQEELPSLLKECGPSMVEVISELNKLCWVAQCLQEQGGNYRAVLLRLQDDAQRRRFQDGYGLLQSMNEFVKESSSGRERYEQILLNVSPYLQESLFMLAKRAQTQLSEIESSTAQLRQEVALWFDRAMDRTSGVYKRNTKGVVLVLGLFLAVSTNTDTLHILNKLARDSTLRTTYSQLAGEVISANPAALNCLEAKREPDVQQNCSLDATAKSLRQALDRTTELPIGWSAANWQDQWQPNQGGIGSVLRLLTGWLFSAIAISMGAPFWFNLLNKVVNVRNSGKPPNSKDLDTPTSSR